MITHDWVLENFEYRSDGLYWRTSNAGRRAGTKAGSLDKKGYRVIGIKLDHKLKFYKEHRLCWFYMTGKWPELVLDHYDRNRSNNAWENLREANYTENNCNSGALGISFMKSNNKWRAEIQIHNKKIYLGIFSSRDDALAARRAAELEHFGEFAPIK